MHGVICYNECGAEIEGKTSRETDRKMVDHGWMLGLDARGQAWYSCPDCAVGLLAPVPVHALDYRKAK